MSFGAVSPRDDERYPPPQPSPARGGGSKRRRPAMNTPDAILQNETESLHELARRMISDLEQYLSQKLAPRSYSASRSSFRPANSRLDRVYSKPNPWTVELEVWPC